jgi:hypothetical protein
MRRGRYTVDARGVRATSRHLVVDAHVENRIDKGEYPDELAVLAIDH